MKVTEMPSSGRRPSACFATICRSPVLSFLLPAVFCKCFSPQTTGFHSWPVIERVVQADRSLPGSQERPKRRVTVYKLYNERLKYWKKNANMLNKIIYTRCITQCENRRLNHIYIFSTYYSIEDRYNNSVMKNTCRRFRGLMSRSRKSL